MKDKDFALLEQKFIEYADSFINNSSQPAPLILKREHTMRVCREIEDLAKEISLSGEQIILARTMALFHDLGRFRQFEEYRTFLDLKSENHARLSIVELKKHAFLANCSDREKFLIQGAIAVHNAAGVPAIKDYEKSTFMKLLRDADKLDIWNVVIGNYIVPDPENSSTVNLGLKDAGGCSDEAISALKSHTYVKSSGIKELNDLKLMQISWVYDLNFPNSVAKVLERSYIDAIVDTLSVPLHYKGLNRVFDDLFVYMKEQKMQLS
ncbi:HD domain protein [Desulfamplus magnetovallimortis]|uniref:HD domain protein n=1 Tax=Desulfamplus magnetovallimortis TaxID=1246637 RepID=A0A1W1H7B2_9BACT|nr:HD domain-containing protein [Desulfamplus magnetovallimortis]SLM28324.1 HD domain protein [Desulfamplus magnetovallimortis]